MVYKTEYLHKYEILKTILNKFAIDVYDENVEKGFWTDIKTGKFKADLGNKIALIHSEASEALEGIRKECQDKHLPHRLMVEVELADLIIRIMDLVGYLQLDIGGAMFEKMEYNKTREDHKMENRLKDGGKKF